MGVSKQDIHSKSNFMCRFQKSEEKILISLQTLAQRKSLEKILKVSKISFSSQKGFSLISALISVVIVGLAASAMVSTLSIQQRETTIIQQRLAASKLEYQMLQTLKNEGMCLCFFGGVNIANGRRRTNIQEITCGDETIAERGESIDETGITVDVLAFTNLRRIDPPPNQPPLEFIDPTSGDRVQAEGYNSTLLIQFDLTSLARPIRDIEIPIHFTLNSTVNSAGTKEVISCGETTDRMAKLTELGKLINDRITDWQVELSNLRLEEVRLRDELDDKYDTHNHDNLYEPAVQPNNIRIQ